MNKRLLAVAVSILLLAGVASAVEGGVKILPIRKISRPSLSKVLDRRPGLPNNMPVTPAEVLPPVHVTTGTVSTGTAIVITGNLVTGATYVSPVYTGELPVGFYDSVPSQYRQNAEDVQAYRIENGYIMRYMKKGLTADERKLIENSVRAILATQKSMTQSYKTALSSDSPMTKGEWDMRSDTAVESYKAAILPYIRDTSMDAFEKFIIGRKNLMKNLFDKLVIVK